MNAGNAPGQTDMSSSSLDFIRAIRVWEVRYRHAERGKDEDCEVSGSVILGEYNAQGEYVKSRQPLSEIPSWIVSDFTCKRRGDQGTRAVGLEWQDHLGNIDHEVIHF